MFRLQTFGALQLTSERGEATPGAAGQRRPLLILALAALVPGGITRERLLRVLWPGVPRERARATLKQHLYALRRATGSASLIAGAPRLSVPRELVTVDAWELAEHVAQGRLHEAGVLLQGDLLEDVFVTANEPLRELIAEVRETYAPGVTLVRRAMMARRNAAAVPGAAEPATSALGVERDVAAAAKRFTRGALTLPDDAIAANHRVASCTHDLLEALATAERLHVPDDRVRELLIDVASLWRRSELVQQMVLAPPGYPGSVATMDWLLDGAPRTMDRVGRALETYVLDSGIAYQVCAGIRWQWRQLADAAARASRPLRVLLLQPRGAREIATTMPWLERGAAHLVINVSDERAWADVRTYLSGAAISLAHVIGDIFEQFEVVADHGPFDVILPGNALDAVPTRPATWLIQRLASTLTPAGVLLLSSFMQRTPHGAWLRHIAHWHVAERDQDDILVLAGDAISGCDLVWDRDAAAYTWLVTLQRDSRAAVGRAA